MHQLVELLQRFVGATERIATALEALGRVDAQVAPEPAPIAEAPVEPVKRAIEVPAPRPEKPSSRKSKAGTTEPVLEEKAERVVEPSQSSGVVPTVAELQVLAAELAEVGKAETLKAILDATGAPRISALEDHGRVKLAAALREAL